MVSIECRWYMIWFTGNYYWATGHGFWIKYCTGTDQNQHYECAKTQGGLYGSSTKQNAKDVCKQHSSTWLTFEGQQRSTPWSLQRRVTNRRILWAHWCDDKESLMNISLVICCFKIPLIELELFILFPGDSFHNFHGVCHDHDIDPHYSYKITNVHQKFNEHSRTRQ